MKLTALASLILVATSSSAVADSVSDTMMRTGLDAEALAASSVQAGEVAGVVEDVEDYLEAHPTDLSSADAAYLSAQADVASLTKLVQSGQATGQDVTDLATAQAALATAESSRDAALDAIFDAGVAGLSGAQSTALSNIRANKGWGTPIEFLVKNHSDQGWLDLAEALTDERVSALEETSASPACVTLLQNERNDADISAAKTAYDTNLSAVQASWTSAVSGS